MSRRTKVLNTAELARYAALLTGGGREMVDVLVSIARSHEATNPERIAAAREVLDRTVGKSAQVVEHEVTITGAALDVGKMDSARLRELQGMLADLAEASGVPIPQLLPAPLMPDAPASDYSGGSDEEIVWDDAEVES